MLTVNSPRASRGILSAVLLVLPLSSAATPFRPTDDGQVLEHVPAGKVARIAQKAPATPEAAAALAQSYIERARSEGDPRWLGYAQSMLRPWWNLALPPAPVLLLRATLRQSQHDFDAALDDLGLLLKDNPRDAQAWLTRATVLRVLGRYPEARAACARLIGLTDDFVPALCVAAVRGLSGELSAALVQIQALEAPGRARPPSLSAWYWAEYTEMLERSGAVEEAAAAYPRALAVAPDDLGLRAAYADFLLDHGKSAEALVVVTRDDGDARVDALRLRQLLAQQQLGRVDASLQAAVADGFAAARQRGDSPHLREEARYVLQVRGDAAQALSLARQNWRVQHEPWDARLLLAAAKAAGQPAAAKTVRDWIAATGYEDARLRPYLDAAP
ncbi:tetratricopeptide repeat protein [Solimonas sp. SE-A11]|uniref:tetratricopeptide repeat protein n=1 Tax=Solimonas sp. SE-A11 TaxID=3054954 RepID=UPI00259D28E6|nr:tetratricopeptide repeat protein [Solimonas sp. SE-A11]MDM4772598.1 hypothetical protein [Solimonas sp. SE-A11]